MEYGKHKETIYGTLIESRGEKLVKSGGKSYSPMGWKKVRIPSKRRIRKPIIYRGQKGKLTIHNVKNRKG